ncbi:MAG TPA: cell division protein FtsA [Candidatus Paceibacterota bacterium]|nr:cell division protein FtsA [Candidatus Paceibacterota bacterium]
MTSSTITGIDIGNATVKVAVARVGQGLPEVVGIGVASSTSGLNAGEIVDMQEAVANTRAALAAAATMAGTPIRRAWLAVSGIHIATQTSRGVVAVARADQEITETDIHRVIDAASVVSLPPNRELIHVIPREFVIDGTEHVRDPLGMKGVRLEADVTLVHGPSRHLRNLAKAVNECGVEVAGFVFAPLASSLASLDKHQKQYGVAHLDFGGGTCALTVWDESDMAHCAILRIGSRHITNDLAILLRTSLENAERIKCELGAVNEPKPRAGVRTKPEMVDLSSYLDEPFTISKRQLTSAMDARARELMDMVAQELKKCGKDGQLPAGVTVSGGGAKIPGFLSMVRDELGLPVRTHRPYGVEAFDAALDPSLAVALGLVVWGYEKEYAGGHRPKMPTPLSGFLGNVGVWLKNFLP